MRCPQVKTLAAVAVAGRYRAITLIIALRWIICFCLIFFSVSARADVVWDFVETALTPGPGSIGGLTLQQTTATLTVSDAVFLSGGLSYALVSLNPNCFGRPCSCPPCVEIGNIDSLLPTTTPKILYRFRATITSQVPMSHLSSMQQVKRPPKTPDRAYPLVKNQEYAYAYDWEHRSG
jgi:hypothetical protein